MAFNLKENPIKAAINRGETVIGMYVAIPSPLIVELAGQAGFDFIRIDCSHSALDLSTAQNMIRAAEARGVVPFVRVHSDPQMILSVLEMGAMGVIIPDVATAEDARAAVDAAKFQPVGERGMFSAARGSGYGAIGGAEYVKWTNEQVLVGVQIESATGVENVEAILDVPGIDIVLSGRGDLAQSLGLPGQKDHPVVLEAEEKIFRAAKVRGIAISVNLDATSANLARSIEEWRQKGAQFITCGHDLAIIRKTFENIVKSTKKG